MSTILLLIPNTCTHCLSYPPPHHPHTPHTLDDKAKKVASQAQADARWIIRNTKPCPHCRYVGIEYRINRTIIFRVTVHNYTFHCCLISYFLIELQFRRTTDAITCLVNRYGLNIIIRLETAAPSSSFVASSVAMISAGCVLIHGIYITIELADTLRKSYIANIHSKTLLQLIVIYS